MDEGIGPLKELPPRSRCVSRLSFPKDSGIFPITYWNPMLDTPSSENWKCLVVSRLSENCRLGQAV